MLFATGHGACAREDPIAAVMVGFALFSQMARRRDGECHFTGLIGRKLLLLQPESGQSGLDGLTCVQDDQR